jgi:hypothetical protein
LYFYLFAAGRGKVVSVHVIRCDAQQREGDSVSAVLAFLSNVSKTPQIARSDYTPAAFLFSDKSILEGRFYSGRFCRTISETENDSDFRLASELLTAQ